MSQHGYLEQLCTINQVQYVYDDYQGYKLTVTNMSWQSVDQPLQPSSHDKRQL